MWGLVLGFMCLWWFWGRGVPWSFEWYRQSLIWSSNCDVSFMRWGLRDFWKVCEKVKFFIFNINKEVLLIKVRFFQLFDQRGNFKNQTFPIDDTFWSSWWFLIIKISHFSFFVDPFLISRSSFFMARRFSILSRSRCHFWWSWVTLFDLEATF